MSLNFAVLYAITNIAKISAHKLPLGASVLTLNLMETGCFGV